MRRGPGAGRPAGPTGTTRRQTSRRTADGTKRVLTQWDQSLVEPHKNLLLLNRSASAALKDLLFGNLGGSAVIILCFAGAIIVLRQGRLGQYVYVVLLATAIVVPTAPIPNLLPKAPRVPSSFRASLCAIELLGI